MEQAAWARCTAPTTPGSGATWTLALIKAWTDWDWPGAGASFIRAIAANPSFPDARAFHSHHLLHMKRLDEAMAEIEHALTLDPCNALFQALYGGDLVFARRCDEAIRREPRYRALVRRLRLPEG